MYTRRSCWIGQFNDQYNYQQPAQCNSDSGVAPVNAKMRWNEANENTDPV